VVAKRPGNTHDAREEREWLWDLPRMPEALGLAVGERGVGKAVAYRDPLCERRTEASDDCGMGGGGHSSQAQLSARGTIPQAGHFARERHRLIEMSRSPGSNLHGLLVEKKGKPPVSQAAGFALCVQIPDLCVRLQHNTSQLDVEVLDV
jgi:hypothetical protein